MTERVRRPTPRLDELKNFYGGDPGKRDSIAPTGALVLMSLTLAEALGNHATDVAEATENIILELQRQAEAMGNQTDKIIAGIEAHSTALTSATQASDKYAGRLVWASWALVLATLAL